jgi:hypothetical protein
MPNIDIENYVEQDRWDYSNECNQWEGGGIRNNDEPKQNIMLEDYVCNDRIRIDEVANILLSFNNTRNCDELPKSSQRGPRELPESSHLQALVKYVS